MNWQKLVFLLILLAVAYLPYKSLQKFRKIPVISLRNSVLLTIWFSLFSLILLGQSQIALIHFTVFNIAVFVITTLFWFVAPWVVRRVGQEPKEVIARQPGWFVLRFEPRNMFLKYSEIIFQQVKFLFLLTVVFGVLSQREKTLLFAAVVISLHLHIFFFLPKREGILFFVSSIPMSFLFSYLILRGYILITASIHIWFYLLINGRYWIPRKTK